VHVAVVDPGVGSERSILVARDGANVFLAPDNGLLGPVLSARAEVRALDLERFSLPDRSRTFHGRDVFAPTAARLAAGLDPSECGPPVRDWARLAFPEPREGPEGELLGEVLVTDRFGNLVTNVPAARLAGPPSEWTASVGGVDVPLAAAYADAAPGSALALVDSFGYWEVAVRDGDAAEVLRVGPGAAVTFRRRS
jgi:S-adenosylmethionine hydrolase